MNPKKLEQMAEDVFFKFTVPDFIENREDKIKSIKSDKEYPYKKRIDYAILVFGLKELMNLPEVKALIEAGDNMREEITNYCGGSKGELEWLKALADLEGVIGDGHN